MGTRVPVYTDTSGVAQITLYEEQGDGTFHKTAVQALRQFREYIVGLSFPAVGVLVSNRFDRGERPWQSPTVLSANGRARSYYAFLRDCVKQHRLVVMTTPSLSGRLFRFNVHELQLKRDMSSQVFSLVAAKYLEALEVSAQPPTPPEEPAAPPPPAQAAPRHEEAQRNVRELTPNLLRILKG